jgi:DNA-binding NtrC family response regulator
VTLRRVVEAQLRERRYEIAPLIERLLGRYAEEYGRSHIRMSEERMMPSEANTEGRGQVRVVR